MICIPSENGSRKPFSCAFVVFFSLSLFFIIKCVVLRKLSFVILCQGQKYVNMYDMNKHQWFYEQKKKDFHLHKLLRWIQIPLTLRYPKNIYISASKKLTVWMSQTPRKINSFLVTRLMCYCCCCCYCLRSWSFTPCNINCAHPSIHYAFVYMQNKLRYYN